MTTVAIHDELMDDDKKINTNRFCCPIFITGMYGTMLGKDNDLFGENGADPKVRSGTLTFVSHKGEIYGITCRHVVEALEVSNFQKHKEFVKLCGTGVPFVEEAQMHFFFPKGNEQVHINTKFHKASGDEFTNSYPDVAIARISPDKMAQIGRQSISLEKIIPDSTQWSDKACGIATGYPEQNRRMIPESDRLAKMGVSTVIAVAPFERVSNTQLTMFYELSDEPEADNLSGMSGGPILWSEEDGWGLIGIVKKGRDMKKDSSRNTESFIEGHAIWIDGEPFSPEVFEQWIAELPRNESPIRDISRSLHAGTNVNIIM